MKRIISSALATAVTVGLALGTAGCSAAEDASETATLTIGSKAPELDIEHWLQDGEGFFKPVTSFEAGKVYVVEFWATWCPPCVSSMPHLVGLQKKHRGEGVQVISVSDEDLETVEEFMATDHPQATKPGTEDEPITIAELTSAYCLTVDPDGSTNDDYMKASGQNGIPSAFIVGKTGQIEWIGHPMEMDEPLAKVIGDDWDRETYKAELAREQAFQLTVQAIMKRYQSGDIEGAIAELDKGIGNADIPEPQKDMLQKFRLQMQFESGDLSEPVLAFFRSEMKSNEGDPARVIQFAMMMANANQEGTDLGPLGGEVIASLDATAKTAPEPMLPALHHTRAQLLEGLGRRQDAIAAEKQAVAASTGRQKERLQAFLDELMGKEEGEGSTAAGDKQEREKATAN